MTTNNQAPRSDSEGPGFDGKDKEKGQEMTRATATRAKATHGELTINDAPGGCEPLLPVFDFGTGMQERTGRGWRTG